MSFGLTKAVIGLIPPVVTGAIVVDVAADAVKGLLRVKE
jgi:hypothetical protein